jgi:hypothetical protein
MKKNSNSIALKSVDAYASASLTAAAADARTAKMVKQALNSLLGVAL